MRFRQIALIALAAAAVPALAFIQAKPPGFEYHPEQSQEQVEQQQGSTGYYEEVGVVEGDIRKPDTSPTSGDPEAARAILQASEDSEKAHNALLQAEKDITSGGRSGPSPVMWGVMVIAVIGLGVFALKKYADKVVPEPPKRKPRW